MRSYGAGDENSIMQGPPLVAFHLTMAGVYATIFLAWQAGYRVSAVDDTKVHRSSPHVWGTKNPIERTSQCSG